MLRLLIGLCSRYPGPTLAMMVLIAVVLAGISVLDGAAPVWVMALVGGMMFGLVTLFWWMVIQNIRRGVNSALAQPKERAESLDAELGIDDIMDLGSKD